MPDPGGLKKRVLAVGDVNVDIVFTGLNKIPLSEQESLALGLETLIGGQTGTTARAMCSLGLPVTFVGRVGDDDYGHKAINELAQAGIDISGVLVDPSLKTGATVVLFTGKERAFATYLGSISEVRRADVKSEFISNAHHLHVGSYYLQETLLTSFFPMRLRLCASLEPRHQERHWIFWPPSPARWSSRWVPGAALPGTVSTPCIVSASRCL